MPSTMKTLALLSAVSTCALAKVVPATKYVLEDLYSGPTFFDNFNFIEYDPTNGFVQYVNESIGLLNGLIDASADSIYMGVDYTTKLNATTSPGRQSIRIESIKSYNASLFIGDFNHMPGGICGTWPAFWSYGPNWPYSGEIDMVEGTNRQKSNLMSLHTGPNCTIAGTFETGTLANNDCYQYSATEDGSGCGIYDKRDLSYGTDFNNHGGGVFATEWTSEWIRIWFFPRGKIPADITSGTPNPSTWGKPASNFEGSCDISSHFMNHKIVLNTELCGDWAGNVFANYPICAAKAASCVDFVAEHPSAFRDAYWSINSVAVYQQQAIAGTSTTTTASILTSSVTPIASIASLSSSLLSEKPPMGTVTTGTLTAPTILIDQVPATQLPTSLLTSSFPTSTALSA